MDNEKLFYVIKNTLHRKFNELEVFESNDVNDIYLHYKNEEYSQIRINKEFGNVHYYYAYKDKICKMIPMANPYFAIVLIRWIEDKFQTKVNETRLDFQKKFK